VAKFIYKQAAGITALSASFTDFTYKKHSHKEYAIGVTLRGIQHYNLDGSLQLSYPSGVMLFNPEQAHDGMAHDKAGLDYVMLYIDPHLILEAIEKKDIIRFSDPSTKSTGFGSCHFIRKVRGVVQRTILISYRSPCSNRSIYRS